MNSRQRLTAVLNGHIPDRVPISTYELVGFDSQAFENNQLSYKPLMDHIRSNTDCVCMWQPKNNNIFLQSASGHVDSVINRVENTVITASRISTPKGSLSQVVKRIDDINTNWQVEHYCKSSADVDKALSVPFEPLTYDFSDFERISAEVGDNGIIMTSLGDALLWAAEMMSFQEYMMWATLEEDHFAATVKLLHERNMINLSLMLEAGVVDLYRICGPEYAAPPYMPPQFFQKYVVPYVSDMVDLIHSKGAKVRVHCHGKIGRVMDMIASTGADAIDPCEAPPDGDTDLAEVKNRIGDRMCIFGNIQLKLLEHGDSCEVAAEVRKTMAVAKQGGRFVIMPTAAPINVPLGERTAGNYRTFIDVALECGLY